MRYSHFLILFFTLNQLFAQTTKTDSLRKALFKATSDEKYTIYAKLVDIALEENPDLAISYATEYFNLAQKQASQKELMHAHQLLALCYEGSEQTDLTIENYETANAYAIELNDTLSKAALNYNLGRLYADQSVYDKALQHLFESLKFYELLYKQKEPGDVLHEIGQVYTAYQKPDKGVEYLKKALDIRLIGRDSIAIASTYNSLAIAYSDMNNHQEAATYYTKSYEICQSLNYPVGMTVTASNIGYEYYSLKNNVKALEYYNIALKVISDNNLKGRDAAVLVNMSYIFYDEGNYTKALEYQQKSLKVAQIKKDESIIQECYQAIAKSYAALQNYPKAYEYQTRFTQLKDSLFKQESVQQAEEIQAKYKFEKKELEIAKLKKEQEAADLLLAKNQQALYGSIAVILLALIIIGLYYNRYRLKQKANQLLEDRNKALTDKNEEIQRQSEVIHETNVKIMDSIRYAKRIQYAVIPDKTTLSHSFPNSFALLKPKDVVSGDFYWCGIKNDKKILVVADCTGHGVPGAFMTIMGSAFINQIIFENQITNPADILTELDRKLKETVQKQESVKRIDDGMDIAICTIDISQQELAFAGAKRPLYLFRNNELKEFKGNKFPIGGNPRFYNKHFTNHIIRYQPDDMIYLFSDGYADQFGGPDGNRKFMVKQFKCLLNNINALTTSKQKQILTQEVQEWQGDNKQTDDILIVGVKL